MKVTLTITSLLSILFTTFHLTDDIVRGMSLLASGLPVIHTTGSGGLTGGIESGGAFFFAWTLIALGVTAIFSVILSARGLWSLRRGQPVTPRTSRP